MTREKFRRKFLSNHLSLLAFLVTCWKHSYTLSIQGTHFDLLDNTFFVGDGEETTSRDHVDCVIRCLKIFGHDLCETASFNEITYSCQITMVVLDNLSLNNGSNYITARKAIQECDEPTIPNGHVTIVNATFGSTASVTCSNGYAVSNSVITCQASRSWTATLCLKDCYSLNLLHADVFYSVPGETFLGSSAVVRCIENYAFASYDVNLTIVCTEFGWADVNGEIPVCWELMFRGTKGNGYNITDIYLYGSASYDASGMTTSLPECQNVFDQTCTSHFRNPNIDNWGSINIDKVRYEFYDGNQTVMSLTIRAQGSNMYNWIEYGKTDWISLPWTDIAANMANTWWAVTDWDTEIGRSFRIIEHYGYCLTDVLYTFVVFEPYRLPNGPVEDIYCTYETDHTIWPQFMYTLNGVKSNFHDQVYGTATTMAIWVLHD